MTLSLLTREQIQRIHDDSMKLLCEIGMQYHHPDAIELVKANGVHVEGDTAFWTEAQVMEWISYAPSSFTLYARNPNHNVVMGEGHTHFAPSYGFPSTIDENGQTTPGTISDYVEFVKLFQANDDFDINGGLIIQPNDVNVGTSNLSMLYAALVGSDKAQIVVGEGTADQFDVMMKVMAETVGGMDYLKEHPCMITIVDVMTPLQFSGHMTETLFKFAEYGQAMAITSCAMAGTTAPVTTISPLVYNNAEVISTIALAQMVRKGAPVMYGNQSLQSDMATGGVACGAPESALIYAYGADMANFYNLPYRAGGAVTDSKFINFQAGMESMITLLSTAMSGANLIIHSAGTMDSYISTSKEKVLADFEICKYVRKMITPAIVDDETIPLDLYREIGHDGTYLAEDHTLEHCNEPVKPMVGIRGGKYAEDPTKARLAAYRAKLLDAYSKPTLSPDVLERMKSILVEAGVPRETLELIDSLY